MVSVIGLYFSAALDECAIFGCNVESDECVCRTETNCLASFSFASQDECQSSLKGQHHNHSGHTANTYNAINCIGPYC